jgi:N-acetylmuramoyl-L-alanine amidase/uncharacterized protein YraI
MAKTRYSSSAPTVLSSNPASLPKPSEYAISQSQMTAWIMGKRGTSPTLWYNKKLDNGGYSTERTNYTVADLIGYYYTYGELEGVDAVVLICQAIHETGWFKFGGETPINYCNYCGLQINGASVRIDNPELGVMAHVQHMALYGRKGECIFLKKKYDPKYDAVANDPSRRGMGPTVKLMSAFWATDGSYAVKMDALFTTYNNYVSSIGESLDTQNSSLSTPTSSSPIITGSGTKVIILDPGHGLSTGGKRVPSSPEFGAAAGMKEHEFNSDVASRAQTLLKNIPVTPSFQVVVFNTASLKVSSEDDVSLDARSDYANKWYQQYSNKADVVFISIHANAGGGIGIETIYPKEPETKGNKKDKAVDKAFAGAIHSELMSYINTNYGSTKDRGTKNDVAASGIHLGVLNYTLCPSILLELGFMDTVSDALRLIDDNYRRVCAEAIVSGLMKYFGSGLSSKEVNGLAIKNAYDSKSIFASSADYNGYNNTSITTVLGNGLAKKIIGNDLKTMQQLAEITGISVAELKALNGLSSDVLSPNMVIYYPTSDVSSENDMLLSASNMLSYVQNANKTYLNFANYADSKISLADSQITGYDNIKAYEDMGLVPSDPKERLKNNRLAIKAAAPEFPAYTKCQIIIGTPTGDKTIEFLIGPNQYSVVRSNKINFEETLGGWNVVKSGKNLTRLSMTGKLMDSDSLLENHAFIEDYKRYIEDHINDKNEYENLNTVKILLEGREYYGYITDIQTNKSTASMHTFDYSINFVAMYDQYKYKTDSVKIYDPNDNSFANRSIITFTEGKRTGTVERTVDDKIITVDANGNIISEESTTTISPVIENILANEPAKNNMPTMSAKVTVNTHLNVRSGPSVNYKIVGKKNNGDIVQILETDAASGWYRIGTDQWITNDSRYVKIIENTVVQTTAPTAKTAEIYNCSMLNVRATPSSAKTSKIVRVLKVGTKVKVYGEQDGWYKISEYGSEWIYSKFARYV